jgi:predicted nucleic acid-binding protein
MLVIDGCIAAKWFIHETDSDRAWSLRQRYTGLRYPGLIVAEVLGVVGKNLRMGVLGPAVAHDICKDVRAALQAPVPDAELLERAAELMVDLAHPIYDCIYLALAERERLPLVTVDRNLIDAGSKLSSVHVVHLREL